MALFAVAVGPSLPSFPMHLVSAVPTISQSQLLFFFRLWISMVQSGKFFLLCGLQISVDLCCELDGNKGRGGLGIGGNGNKTGENSWYCFMIAFRVRSLLAGRSSSLDG